MNFKEAFDIQVEPGQSVMALNSDEPGDWSAQRITITDPLCPTRTITTIAGVITSYTTASH